MDDQVEIEKILHALGVLKREKEQEDKDRPKLVAVAINTKTNMCTAIYSEATYDELASNFTKYYKEYRATNWNGQDQLERTLSLEGVKLTGRSFTYKGVSKGADNDMGHVYTYEFAFDTVAEVAAI